MNVEKAKYTKTKQNTEDEVNIYPIIKNEIIKKLILHMYLARTSSRKK